VSTLPFELTVPVYCGTTDDYSSLSDCLCGDDLNAVFSQVQYHSQDRSGDSVASSVGASDGRGTSWAWVEYHTNCDRSTFHLLPSISQ